jgi:uncharacterized damage-inducible protein DinB
MQAEQARFLLNFLLRQIEEEFATTKKVLAALPEEQRDYRPHPIAKTALELAWHAASSDLWFLDGIIRGQFAAEEPPAGPATVAQLRDQYDKGFVELVARLKALSDEQLMRRIPFFGVLDVPAVSYLLWMLVHTVHHRGQLSTYLRAMGAKVPSIYGGSADEPFQPPA